MADTAKGELIAEIEGMAIFQAMKSAFGFLFDKTTGKIKEQVVPFVFGNAPTLDGLFKRGVSKAIEDKKITAQERAIYHKVLVSTIARDKQNDYRRFLVAACFNQDKLKDAQTIDEEKLIGILARMIAEDVKMAVAHDAITNADARKHSEWMHQLRFYDLDQSLEEALNLEEHEQKLDEEIESNKNWWEAKKRRFPYKLFFR